MRRSVFVIALSCVVVSVTVAVAQDETKRPGLPQSPSRPPAPGLPSSTPAGVADRMAEAHNVRMWRAHPGFSCNIRIEFGGQAMLEGAMLIDTNKDRVRFDLTDGTKLIWDGETAWISPAAAAIEEPRYHLRTWPFFLKAPFALREKGTKVEDKQATMMNGRLFGSCKVTFDAKSTRDTPDDWFIVFTDIATHTLAAMAYINTWGGRSAQEAEREPHIVFYEDPALLNSVVIAQTWSFYHWSESQGKFGEKVGEVKLSDIAFAQIREDTFAKPENAREVAPPGAESNDDDDDDDDDDKPGEDEKEPGLPPEEGDGGGFGGD